MQRDIGNEIIVAIVVVGVLAFALTSAIILSLSSGVTAAGTPAAATVQADDVTPATAVAAVESSATPTDAPATVTDAPTRTPLPPTIAPSATLTRTPSPAPSATTAASATPNPTRTPVPSATSTATLTLTATVRPSATLTPTRRPTVTPSSTPAPSATPTMTEVAVLGTRVFCIAPFGWRLYEVKPGDTLVSLARAVGSAAFDIQVANCLGSAGAIMPGDVIYLPRLPGEPIQTVMPGQAPTGSVVVGTLQAVGCSNPDALIVSPQAGARAAGRVTVTGTAAGRNFGYYLLEVRSDFVTVYTQYLRGAEPVVGGNLGTIDASVFPPGIYWIRLSVFDQSGGINTARCAIPVSFD